MNTQREMNIARLKTRLDELGKRYDNTKVDLNLKCSIANKDLLASLIKATMNNLAEAQGIRKLPWSVTS